MEERGTTVIMTIQQQNPDPSTFFKFLFIYDSHKEREREAETQAEGEAGSMHREPDVGFDPGSSGSGPGPKAGAKLLRHPGIPTFVFLLCLLTDGLWQPSSAAAADVL